jgi:hypothetical protein
LYLFLFLLTHDDTNTYKSIPITVNHPSVCDVTAYGPKLLQGLQGPETRRCSKTKDHTHKHKGEAGAGQLPSTLTEGLAPTTTGGVAEGGEGHGQKKKTISQGMEIDGWKRKEARHNLNQTGQKETSLQASPIPSAHAA